MPSGRRPARSSRAESPPGRSGSRQTGRSPSAGAAATIPAARARRISKHLAERRRQQDRLVDAAVAALADQAAARARLEGARTTLDEAVAALDALGTDRESLAVLLGVPVHHLSGAVVGRAGARVGVGVGVGGNGSGPAPVGQPALVDDDEDREGAVRLWLAVNERGSSPRTHALDRDGGLLCRRRGDAGELTTWIGYPFDADCQSCARILADQLTAEEFG